MKQTYVRTLARIVIFAALPSCGSTTSSSNDRSAAGSTSSAVNPSSAMSASSSSLAATATGSTPISASTSSGSSASSSSASSSTGPDASLATSSSASSYIGTKTPGTAQSGDVTVDPGTTYQTVDGFGEADVWQGTPSAAQQTLLFDPVNGIGLTLLRVGIESVSGTSVIMGSAGLADGPVIAKFGGKVWAAPWSPPAADKNNGNVDGPGSNNTLNTADYQAWATTLAAFPAYYKAQTGVDLYAVSAQNEPDFNASYESCLYSASQLVSFIDLLGPKLAALNPPVKVLAAEPDNWGNLWGGDKYGPAILADTAADSYVGPIATHDYGGTSAGTFARPAPPANNTHHVWETECTPSGTDAITIATMIYAAFTTGGVSGWHYWWTESLLPNGASNPPPQLFALGNFSKYVRPGYLRAGVTGAATPSASAPLVVAFTNPPDATLAIVVVNGGGAAQVSFFVSGTAWPGTVTPYVTSATAQLASGTPIPVTAARFTASLDAQSVTTFVGKP